ncbi:MAG TPA: CoA transferase, partial [Tepidiformaceae bacterium]|nr:CoA transferase [Tepidiformaceae bacterium]
GNDDGRMAPHGVFPCSGEDRWVAVAIDTQQEWQALCAVIGRPELVDDSRFATPEARRANREQAGDAIAAWTRSRTPHAVQAALQGAGVAAGAVLDAGELLRDPHVAARRGMVSVDVPGVGETPYPRLAFTLSSSAVGPFSAAPGYGADARDILPTLEGYGGPEYERLVAAGVIFEEPPA